MTYFAKKYLSSFLLMTFLSLCLVLPLQADQKEDLGDYVLHYNVLPSTFLTPKIAEKYQIMRSRSIAVVNLVLIKKPKTPVSAIVQGTLTNDAQQTQTLSFNQITEGKSIYYIAQLPFREGELLTFKVTLIPNGVAQPLVYQFSQNIFN
jgi:hypothetical protein